MPCHFWKLSRLIWARFLTWLTRGPVWGLVLGWHNVRTCHFQSFACWTDTSTSEARDQSGGEEKRACLQARHQQFHCKSGQVVCQCIWHGRWEQNFPSVFWHWDRNGHLKWVLLMLGPYAWPHQVLTSTQWIPCNDLNVRQNSVCPRDLQAQSKSRYICSNQGLFGSHQCPVQMMWFWRWSRHWTTPEPGIQTGQVNHFISPKFIVPCAWYEKRQMAWWHTYLRCSGQMANFTEWHPSSSSWRHCCYLSFLS